MPKSDGEYAVPSLLPNAAIWPRPKTTSSSTPALLNLERLASCRTTHSRYVPSPLGVYFGIRPSYWRLKVRCGWPGGSRSSEIAGLCGAWWGEGTGKKVCEGAEMPMDDGGIFRAAHVVT